MENFLSKASKSSDEIKDLRRKIHSFGGIGFDLDQSAELIKSTLASYGIKAKEICKNGIIADIGSGSPVILLRADFDALPVEEQSGLPFAATNGSCHCCGHDFHSSMLLYAAKMLKEVEHELCGTVRIMFQPAEETGKGCKAMIDAGLLENPKVDSSVAIHVAVGNEISASKTVHYSRGPAFAASDTVNVKVIGKGGHGAQPHTSADPITAAAAMINAYQHIVSMEVASDQRAVLTIGSIHGGKASNVIPSSVEMHGTLRTYVPEVRELMKRRFREISENTAKAYGTEAEVVIDSGMGAVYNDPALCDSIFPYIEEVTGKDKTSVMDYPTSYGSEDYAFIASSVPSVILKLGAGSKSEGYENPLHHPAVMFNEDVLAVGAAVYANCAFRWLLDNSK